MRTTRTVAVIVHEVHGAGLHFSGVEAVRTLKLRSPWLFDVAPGQACMEKSWKRPGLGACDAESAVSEAITR